MAVVQLQFQKDVDEPLKPLRDDISDGYFGMFKVERQLDLNPSMFYPLTLYFRFVHSKHFGHKSNVHFANCFLSTHKTDSKKGFKTTTFETLI